MSYVARPGSISVEEMIDFPDEVGSYSYYQIEKQTGSMDSVCRSMAKHLDVTPSAVVLPSLRDFAVPTKQYASVRKPGPEIIQDDGYVATLIRSGPRKLRAEDIRSNYYTVRLDALPQTKLATFKGIVGQLASNGLPNYYGNAIFRTNTDAGFIGEAIVKHRAKLAIRLYLAEPQQRDGLEVRTFKTLVKQHWGQWGYLLHQAPQPSNYRSVMTYLKDNAEDYEGAINLVRDQYLKTYLIAYQAYLWNQVLALYLTQKGKSYTYIHIAGQAYPLLLSHQHKSLLANLDIELPRLTASYSRELESVVNSILQHETLTFSDFDVRLLRRVCFIKDSRSTLLTPNTISTRVTEQAEKPNGVFSAVLTFNLAPEQYASLIIDAIGAYLDQP